MNLVPASQAMGPKGPASSSWSLEMQTLLLRVCHSFVRVRNVKLLTLNKYGVV